MLDANWPKLPADTRLGQSSGLGVDSHNHVFIFHRAEVAWSNEFPQKNIESDTVYMFDGESGELLLRWGANSFVMPHGLSVDAEDNIWLSDAGAHQVHKYSHEGERLLSLGEAGVQGDDNSHFARPTDITFDNAANVYISDGYLNTRVVKFNDAGKYLKQWGSPGSKPGQFNLPHGLASDGQHIYVADRDNARLQVFDTEGHFLRQHKGTSIGRPFALDLLADKRLVVMDGGDFPDNIRSRVVITDDSGIVLHSFSTATAADQANLGHDISSDAEGNIYVADIAAGRVSKFVRQAAKPD